MKLQLSQLELVKLHDAGKTAIWQFNTLYQVEWSHGVNEYIIRKVFSKPTAERLGVTQRGRFIAMTTEQAQRYL